jgi:hypothetical protein
MDWLCGRGTDRMHILYVLYFKCTRKSTDDTATHSSFLKVNAMACTFTLSLCYRDHHHHDNKTRHICMYLSRRRPVENEIRLNDPDICGFYFMPYESIRRYIAQFQGFYVNSFDIEWAPQSFYANRHHYRQFDYTLLRNSTRLQNRSRFDGPFPFAHVVPKTDFHME